jgi:hypothetical protein
MYLLIMHLPWLHFPLVAALRFSQLGRMLALWVFTGPIAGPIISKYLTFLISSTIMKILSLFFIPVALAHSYLIAFVGRLCRGAVLGHAFKYRCLCSSSGCLALFVVSGFTAPTTGHISDLFLS